MKQSAIFIKKENLLSVLALIAVNTFSVGSASAIGLVNPSFEDNNVTTLQAGPKIEGSDNPGYVIVTADKITGWKTTASDNGIELWQSGFRSVNAAPGNGGQFAEVSGTQASTLFQDLTIAASGGATQLYFNFWHRARENSNGGAVQTNAVRLIITDSASPILFSEVFATQLNPNDINATNNGWANYTSASFAPFSAAAGASRTISFAFDAIEGTPFIADQYQTTGAVPTSSSNFSVTTTNANAQTGNFLDNANFSDDPATVPFDFSPNLAIGVLGGLYLGRKVLKSLKKKKDID